MTRKLFTRMMVVFAISVFVGGSTRADPQPMPLRSFDRFQFDTENARGLWLEFFTAATHAERNELSTDVITLGPRLVYGTNMLEGGLVVPYRRVDVDLFTFIGQSSSQEDGIGDMQLYAKFIPLRGRWLDAGIGFDLSLPSGDAQRGLGAGEVGLLPYGMASLHAGPVDVRAHLGYEAFVDSTTNFSGNDVPADSFVYGGGLFSAIGHHVAVRAEFVGQSFDNAAISDAVLFEPGFDVRIPAGPIDLLLRPTGAVGITDDAPDWGVGGSVVVTWDPLAPQ